MGPRGLMDKASDFGSEDCEFESRRGRKYHFFPMDQSVKNPSTARQRMYNTLQRKTNLIPISK